MTRTVRPSLGLCTCCGRELEHTRVDYFHRARVCARCCEELREAEKHEHVAHQRNARLLSERAAILALALVGAGMLGVLLFAMAIAGATPWQQ